MTTIEAEPRTVARRRSAWWREILLVYAFYVAYSRVRGKGRSSRIEALHNARRLLDWERIVGLNHERSFQRLVLHSDQVIVALNYFYGTAHFVVTPVVAIWLFRRRASAYRLWRNVLGWATGLALVGYYVFPLMPPRLVPGGGFADTMVTHPNLWRLTPIPIWNVGNPYAAMPSLHIAWSLWVCCALLATVRSRPVRLAARVYPCLTVVAIVATGNHYLLDAAGGALVIGAGMALAPACSEAIARLRNGAARVVEPVVPGDDRRL